MGSEPKRLDAVVVDVEDSTTLLKLYVGRLVKTPARTSFVPPLVEHSREVLDAVSLLHEADGDREPLVRIATALVRLASGLAGEGAVELDRVLVLQETIDLLEAQLDHMLQDEAGTAPEVTASLGRIEAVAATPANGPSGAHAKVPGAEERFEEDPFDELFASDDFFDELVDGIDEAFSATRTATRAAARADAPEPVVDHGAQQAERRIHVDEVTPGPVTLSESEENDLKELFAQIASAYVGPIVDFVGRLRVGPVAVGWVDLCEPAIDAMSRASDSMGYASLRDELVRFGAILADARSRGRAVAGDDRALALAAYERLSMQLPAAFPTVEANVQTESEAIILNSLLKQIKGVGRVTIGRLFAAGLVTLEAYYVADPGDLAAAAGIRHGLAETICERFAAYRDVSELALDRDIVVRRIESLVDDLRAAQFAFKRATLDEWYTREPSRAKAKARRERQQTMWKVNVSLAELGELDLLAALKDEIYDKRIERLSAFVARERDTEADGAAS
jgi:hypothetical protein